MGNYEEALRYLEPAAAALPNEPLVLYHLGKAYIGLNRDEDALRLEVHGLVQDQRLRFPALREWSSHRAKPSSDGVSQAVHGYLGVRHRGTTPSQARRRS